MKKNYFLALCFGLLSLSIYAQSDSDRTNRRDEIEAQKVAYITSKLNLSTEEAQRFWPIYNEYRSDLDALRKDRNDHRIKPDDEDQNLTDAQIDELIKSKFESERRKIDLDEKYYEKFKTALPVSKVAAYYRAERSFKRELLNQLRQKPNGGAKPRN